MTDDSKTFREAVEAVRVALDRIDRQDALPWRCVNGEWRCANGYPVLPDCEFEHPATIFNALPTILDLADEALAHRDAQDAIGDWLEKVDQFEADVRKIVDVFEYTSKDRLGYWLDDLDYPGQPPEGVMP